METGITHEKVVAALDRYGLPPEGLAILTQYVSQCELDAEIEVASHPGDAKVSNRANIKANIKIGRALFVSEKTRSLGRESLEQTLGAALQREDTADLAQEIESILKGEKK